jgi:hypothetical protein
MLKSFFMLCLAIPGYCIILAQPAVKDMSPVMPDSLLNIRLAYLGRLYKLDSTALGAYDKIITFDREVFVGKIHNITFSEVRFTCPPDDALNAINKSRISQILYTDGRRDVFIPLENRTVKQIELVDTARIIIKNQHDWMKVKVTEDPADVVNLTVKGNIRINYEAETGNEDNDQLMRQAGIMLKKKATILKAHCVLIETKFFQKAYGDLPRVEVTARAFGYK